ncbi:MAG: glycine cleavage system protein H [Lentisphaeria bacterium]|nr:glycine cleavage system protein H [Lentisphaerota bacterium]MBR7143364.1 glycine cleavage system protein H [Lentisphaeria bacterium]
MKYYTEDHVWVEIRGDEATIGISQHAIDEFGEINGLELPPEDEDVIVGDDIGLLEFANDDITIYTPLSGTIISVNDDLENSPELIDESPEDKGWLCKITNIDESELADMMNETSYRKYLRSLKR